LELIIDPGARRHGYIPSLVLRSRWNYTGRGCFIGHMGVGNKSAVAVVPGSIKVGTIEIRAGIKELFMASEWVLPIKDRWVPVHIASHDDMGKGLKFLVCKWTQIQVRQPIADMEGELIPIIGDNELTIGIHTAGTLVNLVMERL